VAIKRSLRHVLGTWHYFTWKILHCNLCGTEGS